MPPVEMTASDRSRAQTTPARSFSRMIRRNLALLGLFVVLVLVVGSFLLGRYSVYKAHPELSGQEQASAILSKVSQLIQLPQNETPTMAKVTDAAAVRAAQPFLANAQNGDVLIVYTGAKTALLYRPSTNKLIAVGPVTPQTANQPSAAESPIQVTSSTTHASSTNATSSPSKK